MARRSPKAEAALTGVAVLIGLPIYLFSKLAESVGWLTLVGVLAGAIALWLWYRSSQRRKRVEYLTAKYQDPETFQRIMDGIFWQGQSEEQLIDSIGRPVDVDRTVMKTKTKETWKYNHRGANRYGLRITLENGCVVGWDNKA